LILGPFREFYLIEKKKKGVSGGDTLTKVVAAFSTFSRIDHLAHDLPELVSVTQIEQTFAGRFMFKESEVHLTNRKTRDQSNDCARDPWFSNSSDHVKITQQSRYSKNCVSRPM
jgi:hypothetical protein